MGAGTGDLGRLPRPCCGRYCGVPVAAIRRFVAVLLLVSVPATRSQQAGRYGVFFVRSLCMCVEVPSQYVLIFMELYSAQAF